jgi:hypothetical protein
MTALSPSSPGRSFRLRCMVASMHSAPGPILCCRPASDVVDGAASRFAVAYDGTARHHLHDACNPNLRPRECSAARMLPQASSVSSCC